jgi:hypothetical protein
VRFVATAAALLMLAAVAFIGFRIAAAPLPYDRAAFHARA